MSPRLRPFLPLLLVLVALALVLGAGWQAGRWARDGLETVLRGRLEVYAQSLDSAIERYAHLPFTVALDPGVIALAAGQRPEAEGERINRYLAAVSERAGAPVLYLLDRNGLTIAASNWDRPDSYVGINFGYRPYFQHAIAGREGHFYGIGTVTGIPGYFISAPVTRKGEIVGVAVVKLRLEAIEAAWAEAGDLVLVTDRNGVAFLSSDPALRLHTSGPLSAGARDEITRTRQYIRADLPLLPFAAATAATADGDGGGRDRPQLFGVAGTARLLGRRELERDGWSLLLLLDAAPLAQAERMAALGTAFLLSLGGGLFLIWRQRRRRQREGQVAKVELERKVAERTADLLAANARLEREVDQRTRTEADLRAAQNELVQAAKLAVLGQMAAGVTHELNQPLTALRGLAENGTRLLDHGREAEVRENLAFITRLVDRMARITGQLRGFSRRSEGPARPVPLGGAIREALALLEQRLSQQRIRVSVEMPDPDPVVGFEPVRLAQVLVNLLRNAADALKGQADARISVRVAVAGDQVRLEIADNGPGIAADVAPRIFDPFFTTKPAGEGLGLGLAISQVIAREYGAQLTAANLAEGGACFTLILRSTLEEGPADAP